MNTYKTLQIIVFSYSALVALWVLFSFYFEIKNKFRSVEARFEMFQVLNKLQGKTFILAPFQILSVFAIISWVILALPLVDIFMGTNLITHDLGIGMGVDTWFGTFQGRSFDYYFLTVMINIIAAKGYFVCKRMADILSMQSTFVDKLGILQKEGLAVSKSGHWGARSQF